MRRRGRGPSAAAVALLACGVACPPAPAAASIETSIGRAAVVEAVRLGSSADPRDLDRVHGAYRRLLGGPFLQSIEIITEFRRAVLTTEQARGAGRPWDAASAERALEPFRGLATIIVRVRFDPRNTYRSIPALEAVIYPRGGGVLVPVDQRTTPSFLSGPAPPGTPIIEGTLEAQFLAAPLEGESLVGIFLEGKEIERILLDFSAIR